MFIVMGHAHALPTEMRGVQITEQRVIEIEDMVKSKLGVMKPLYLSYRLHGSIGLGRHGLGGRFTGKHTRIKRHVGLWNPRNRLITFDGRAENILAHEIAHVYGADEKTARKIALEFS